VKIQQIFPFGLDPWAGLYERGQFLPARYTADVNNSAPPPDLVPQFTDRVALTSKSVLPSRAKPYQGQQRLRTDPVAYSGLSVQPVSVGPGALLALKRAATAAACAPVLSNWPPSAYLAQGAAQNAA